MLEPVQRKFILSVGNTRDGANHSVVVYADSVSKAVELFLQDYLKNNRIVVGISEQSQSVRKI
jgi:hypothetical protein